MEQWKPIPGFSGWEASDQGRIRSIDRTIIEKSGKQRMLRGRVLKPWLWRGYRMVELGYRREGEKRKSYKVAALVLMAFVCARPAGYIIRHLDDDRSNDKLTNLTWGTYSENIYDQIRNGKCGVKNAALRRKEERGTN